MWEVRDRKYFILIAEKRCSIDIYLNIKDVKYKKYSGGNK